MEAVSLRAANLSGTLLTGDGSDPGIGEETAEVEDEASEAADDEALGDGLVEDGV